MFLHINYSDLFKPQDILVYLRKSRADDPLMTIEDVLAKHETMLEDWVEKNLGGTVPPENKFFEVVSGETIADRPELQKVLRMIESPKVKAILCYDVSRISRGDLEDAGRLIKILRYTNTYVITLQKVYDLADEYDRDVFERELKRGNEYLEYFKRISNNGRLLSVRQGNFIGGRVPYGYDRIFVYDGKRKCPTLTPNPEQAKVIQMIFDMYVNQNMGCDSIARRLNELKVPTRKNSVWTRETIRTFLGNEHYIGKVRWQGRKTVTSVENSEISKKIRRTPQNEVIICDGKHPAIIDEKTFWAAQEKRGRNPRKKTSTLLRNPLAGLVYCKQCGYSMIYAHPDKNLPPRICCPNHLTCNTRSCYFNDMIEVVKETLASNIADFELKLLDDDGKIARDFRDGQIARLKAKLADIDKKELGQWDLYSSGEMPKEIFASLNEKVKAEKIETQQALEKALADNPAPVDYSEKIWRFSDALNALDDKTVSIEKKNALLKACIERINFSNGEFDGTYSGRWKNLKIVVDITLKI